MTIELVYRVRCDGPCRGWLSIPDDYQPGEDLPLAALEVRPTAARAGMWPDETAARRAAFAAGWSRGLCPDCGITAEDAPRREPHPTQADVDHAMAVLTKVQGQPAAEPSPVCHGFRWIGQSFATCDRCGRPAWEHEGEEVRVPIEGGGPFDGEWTTRPWKPGEADAIRAKWGTPADEEPRP